MRSIESIYSKEIERCSLLSKNDEKELGRIIREGYILILAKILDESDTRNFVFKSSELKMVRGWIEKDPALKPSYKKWQYLLSVLETVSARHPNNEYLAKFYLDCHVVYLEAKKAVDILTTANLRLVRKMAGAYKGSISDIIQEGNIGLISAAWSFDYRRNKRFSTWAGWHIAQSISRVGNSQFKMVRLPDHLWTKASRFFQACQEMEKEGKSLDSMFEIAKRAGLKEEETLAIRKAMQNLVRLDAPVGEEKGHTRVDFMADMRECFSYSILRQKEICQNVRAAVEKLPLVQKKVLKMRFGIDGEDMKLEEIGVAIGRSKERARQHVNGGLKRLREKQPYRDLLKDL